MTEASGEQRPATVAAFLEELRSIAQLGLNYARDPYDRERYERLLALASAEYAKLSGLPEDTIVDRFRSELGHVTPKVGVDAAIFAPDGRLLLTRRTDDGLWCLPCGWADLGETAEEAIRREVWEETALEVEVGPVIAVFSRLPGAFGQSHTSYHIVYHCFPTGGAPAPSAEASEVGYYDYTTIADWHRDHGERAAAAHRFWADVLSRGSAWGQGGG